MINKPLKTKTKKQRVRIFCFECDKTTKQKTGLSNDEFMDLHCLDCHFCKQISMARFKSLKLLPQIDEITLKCSKRGCKNISVGYFQMKGFCKDHMPNKTERKFIRRKLDGL